VRIMTQLNVRNTFEVSLGCGLAACCCRGSGDCGRGEESNQVPSRRLTPPHTIKGEVEVLSLDRSLLRYLTQRHSHTKFLEAIPPRRSNLVKKHAWPCEYLDVELI
jgi:hypothetical protein